LVAYIPFLHKQNTYLTILALEIQFLKYTNIVNAKENIRDSHKKTMWISYNIRKSSAGPTRTHNGFQTSEIYGLPNSDSANAVRHTFF